MSISLDSSMAFSYSTDSFADQRGEFYTYYSVSTECRLDLPLIDGLWCDAL